MASITLKAVSKRYRDGTLAVRGVDLEIADGEFMILVGPSGCGKTTLLRMIAGLEAITDGEVLVDDVVVNDLTPRKRDIAMVFQNYALYPHMTVAKNMGFALRRAGVAGDEIRTKVEHAAELLGIADQLERKPGNLSGGQRQRVAMGRAIVRDPQAFLMDEPLSNLDAKLRIQMRSEITRIQRRLHTTPVYVTHDQTEAMTLGDRLAVMRDGVIQQLGTPDELYNHPRNVFVAGFIGAPAMNFLIGEIADGSLASSLGTIALADLGDAAGEAHDHSGRVVVGLRPESFEDAGVVTERPGLVAVTAMVDVLESTGSDVYAHLSLNGAERAGSGSEGPGSEEPGSDDHVLRELAQATASEDPEVALATGSDLVARVGVSHSLTEGQEGRLWIDAHRIHLFDPATGRRLSA